MMDIVEWLREKSKGFFKPTSTRLKEAAEEIEALREERNRLREVLKECSADFATKSSDHRVAAQEIVDEFERRALLARAALKEKE